MNDSKVTHSSTGKARGLVRRRMRYLKMIGKSRLGERKLNVRFTLKSKMKDKLRALKKSAELSDYTDLKRGLQRFS
jgi:hypothetical protein